MEINLKRITIFCLYSACILSLYWINNIGPQIAMLMLTKTNPKDSLIKMITFKDTSSSSNRTKVDAFIFTLSRQNTINGKGTKTTYTVSDTYVRFGVNHTLSCWKDNEFGLTFEENCNIVQLYPYGESKPYLQELGLAGNVTVFSNSIIPVFVTAASSNHFLEVQAQIQNLHRIVYPNYENIKLIFYDIGLSDSEKNMVEQYCRCEYRKFPFDKFPEHVKVLKGYTFKPLITQIVLNEYGFVFWMDASVRFRTGKLDTLFDMAVKDGIKIREGGLGVGYRTDPLAFKFLGEDPCLFADKNEIQATYFLLYRNRFTLENIMRPWVSCALTLGCMYFQGSQNRLSCVNQNGLGFCHRFDQSILSIILWRLYHADFTKVLDPQSSVDIQRDNTAHYFESISKRNLSSFL